MDDSQILLARRLAALWENSSFRAGIHLSGAERAELEAIGLATALERSRPLITARLGPAQPTNDGRQTPWHGYPTFPAQHATATCCRACLAKHHDLPAGVPLSEANLDYMLECLRHYWERELVEAQPCQCRRCGRGPRRSPSPRRSPAASLTLELELMARMSRDGRLGIGD